MPRRSAAATASSSPPRTRWSCGSGDHCLALRDRRRTGGEFDVRHAEVDGDGWSDVACSATAPSSRACPCRCPDDWTVGSAVVVDGTHWRVAERWG